jgi:3-dehydroquinate dehydratase-2
VQPSVHHLVTHSEQGLSTILLLNGPNLNLLGSREPDVYGKQTLPDIEARLSAQAAAAGHRIESFQSNGEQALIERIHQAKSDGVAFILINPAAFTHTSVALRDALAAVALPVVEVHLSNVAAREEFRQRSLVTPIAVGIVSGFGPASYRLGLEALLDALSG